MHLKSEKWHKKKRYRDSTKAVDIAIIVRHLNSFLTVISKVQCVICSHIYQNRLCRNRIEYKYVLVYNLLKIRVVEFSLL